MILVFSWSKQKIKRPQSLRAIFCSWKMISPWKSIVDPFWSRVDFHMWNFQGVKGKQIQKDYQSPSPNWHPMSPRMKQNPKITTQKVGNGPDLWFDPMESENDGGSCHPSFWKMVVRWWFFPCQMWGRMGTGLLKVNEQGKMWMNIT